MARVRSGADEDHRQRPIALVDVVHRGVDRGHLVGGGLLQFVDEDEGADAQVAAGPAEHLEQAGQAFGEPSGVGGASLRID